MAPTFPHFNPARIRTYIFRLPLFTRIAFLLILVFWLLELQSVWDVVQWGALVPQKVNLGTSMFCNSFLIHKISMNVYPGGRGTQMLITMMLESVYRLNTYPLIHLGFIHVFLNAIALLPLLERFEAEHGTLLTGVIFAGRALPSGSPLNCPSFSAKQLFMQLFRQFRRLCIS